jgi:tetratricopeptide (TPR) repeat protein
VLPVVILLMARGVVSAQEPEVIHLDPDRPLIQDPGTVKPEEAGAAPPAAVAGPPAGEPPPDLRALLADLWFRQRALLERGGGAEAEQQIQAALAFMRRERLRAAPEVAGAFFADGRRALDEERYDRARDAFGAATRFDPSLAAAHYGLATVRLRADRDLGGALDAIRAGLGAQVGDPVAQAMLAANALLIVTLGVLAGAVLTFLILGWQRVAAFFHDLQEKFSGRFSGDSARLIGWTGLLLPCLFFLPWAWVLAVWAVLLGPYFRGRSRVAVVVLLATLLAAVPIGHALRVGFTAVADPGARALIATRLDGHDADQLEGLRALAAVRPEDPFYLFVLGGVEGAAGRFEAAERAYRRALEIDARHARAMVNLGNLHALRQEPSLAQNLYKKAAEADPDLALAPYNSHLVYLSTFEMEAADAALEEARRRDPALIGRLAAPGSPSADRPAPRDCRPSARELFGRAIDLGRRAASGGSGRSWIASPGPAGAAGLAGLFILPGLGLVPRRSSARRCQRCGRPYCRRCQSVGKHPDVCSQCLHLFILRDGVAPGVRQRKMQDVARHARRLWIGARIVSLVLPGGGHILGGRLISGAILVGGWSMVWLCVILWGRLLVMPGWVAPAGLAWAMVPLAAGGLLIWLWANLATLKRRRD